MSDNTRNDNDPEAAEVRGHHRGRGAIETRNAAPRQQAGFAQWRLAEKTVTLVPSARLALVDPRPRSHRAKCSSSNTFVLPRGETWA
jgi:hypothetical protein